MTAGPPGADTLLALMSVLAHDLRTPLTPVKGYAEIIRTRPGLGPEKTADYAEIIVRAAARIERSIDMMSGISALYGGRAEIRPESIRAADIVAERLDSWRGREPERTFVADADAVMGAVFVDRGWFGRALDVVVDQVLKSAPEGSTIVMAARADADGGTSFRVSPGEGAGAADPAGSVDSLASAFLTAVCDVCGYRLTRDLALCASAPPSR